jgi:hypothetical protein
MTAFTYKGYGRIYTNPENIREVKQIIQYLDQFEWMYYPVGLVAPWDIYPKVEYVGKFVLNEEEFKALCKKANIPVFIFDSGMNSDSGGYYPTKPLTKDEIKQRSYGELK